MSRCRKTRFRMVSQVALRNLLLAAGALFATTALYLFFFVSFRSVWIVPSLAVALLANIGAAITADWRSEPAAGRKKRAKELTLNILFWVFIVLGLLCV